MDLAQVTEEKTEGLTSEFISQLIESLVFVDLAGIVEQRTEIHKIWGSI